MITNNFCFLNLPQKSIDVILIIKISRNTGVKRVLLNIVSFLRCRRKKLQLSDDWERASRNDDHDGEIPARDDHAGEIPARSILKRTRFMEVSFYPP